jgi:hypothetical protein
MTKLKVTPKLEFVKVKPIRLHRLCDYCQGKFEEFIVVISQNEEIFKFFHRPKFGSPNKFFLCPECFGKLHSLLEEIESEDWETLDPDSEEFKDLDAEVALNDEDGVGFPEHERRKENSDRHRIRQQGSKKEERKRELQKL